MEGRDVWPLVGREPELSAIDMALTSGGAGGVLLVGAAGVGKTRLMREALARWSGRTDALWVTATRAAAAIPFGAVSHLAPANSRTFQDPLALLSTVADGLAERTSAGPVLVGIDDAHLLDESSATLLYHLATRGLVTPVVSVRGGEPVPDAVTALGKDIGLRLPVRPLPPAAADQLMDVALPGPLDPISRARLHQLTAGYPLLLRELMGDAQESGALIRRLGVWCWRGPVPYAARLAELTASWLDGLDARAMRVAETIACAEPVSLALLSRLHEPVAIEGVERRGIAVAERSGNRAAIRLAHPLYAEVLRAGLPASRARAIWDQLAATLAAGPLRRREDQFTLGRWELEAGVVRHPDALLAAAREAILRFDFALAERLVRAVRGTTKDGAADLLLARILHLRGRNREAVEVVPARSTDVRSAVIRASILHCGPDRAGEALRALDAIRGDAPDATRAWLWQLDGRSAAALETARAVLARSTVDEEATLWAATTGTIAAGLLGDTEQATAIAVSGYPVASAAAERIPWGYAQLDCGQCLALLAAGRLTEAAELVDEGHRATVALGARQLTGIWAALRGVVAKAQGRIADARVALREAAALLDEDTHRLVPVCLAELAGAHALAGDATAARDCLDLADARPAGTNRLVDAWVELNRAWVEAAGGALSTGAEVALRAAELARVTGQPTIEATCLFDAARLGAAGLVRERLAAVARTVGTPLATSQASVVSAWVVGDGDALARAAERFARSGHVLLAAEVMAIATRAYRRAGHLGHSHGASQRATALAGMCQGARTPLLRYDGEVRTLSRREHEVAMMAATMPSKQIAHQLGLSVHTVNNTLGRAFAKLGVTSRRELAALFAGAPR